MFGLFSRNCSPECEYNNLIADIEVLRVDDPMRYELKERSEKKLRKLEVEIGIEPGTAYKRLTY